MVKGILTAFRTPDLRKKIFFTLWILFIFRLGTTIPVPNVNVQAINECAAIAQTGDAAGLYSLLNLFSGGALLRLSVFALGIMPYITSSIILQLLTVVIPRLESLKKEGAAGQEKITQYTRYLTLVLAVLQATTFVTLAVNGQMFQGCNRQIVYDKSIFMVVLMVLVMTAGTSIIMWLGELITDRGLGNGMSVLIFTQITAQFPTALWAIRMARPGAAGWWMFAMVIGVGLLIILAVVFIEQGQRRIQVQYAKRMAGNRLIGGTTTYIPIKVNQSGVIPVIFASSMLYLPVLIAIFQPQSKFGAWIHAHWSDGTHWAYNLTYFLLVVAFCFFYVAITFNAQEVSDNMKKYGGFIPGIRAGKPTERYLAYVLNRLTTPGSLYLGLIAMLPTLAFILVGANQNFPFGGTSLLIMVGVGMDMVKRIESQLQQRHYEGFLR